MNFTKLNKRINVEKYDEITNDNGFDIGIWNNYKTVWASVNNLYGKEYWTAKAINCENTVEFIVRYSKDLEQINSKEYRICFKGRLFNITFIDNIKFENKYLKIKAVEIC